MSKLKIISEKKVFFFIVPEGWTDLGRNRGSAIMRAHSPAYCLANTFGIEAKVISSSDIDITKNVKLALEKFKKENIFLIWVKDLSNVKKWSNQGYTTIFDPVDMKLDSDYFRQAYNPDYFNFIFASSESHKNYLINLKASPEKILIADHLSTNITETISRNHFEKNKPVIGIIEPTPGENVRAYKKQMLSDFELFCSKNDLEFKFKDPSRLYRFNTKNGIVEGLQEAYSGIDIGVSLFCKREENFRFTIKPSTKLSAWASFEIPCILSYDKYIEKYPFLKNLIIDSGNHSESFDIILKLIYNREFWEESKSVMKLLKEDFSMHNCKKNYYENILKKRAPRCKKS